jgi:methylated-DNA-protein-cysteine methyltransferase related protein
MKKNMQENTFYSNAVSVIKNIPFGKVATYGQIAMMAGNYRAARQISWILRSSSKKHDLPWHRIINKQGKISLRKSEGYELQEVMLKKEGIIFEDDKIDLSKYLWKA